MHRTGIEAQQHAARVSFDALHRMMLPHRLLNMLRCTLFHSLAG